MKRKGAARILTWMAALAWSLIIGGATPIYAQSNTGTIRGFVRDSEGNPLTSARVVAVQQGTNFQRGALSTATGFYNIPGLPPGQYTLRASSIGQADQDRPVRVLIGQVINIDVQMSVQAIALAEIQAVARRSALETTNPEIATNVTPEQMEALPMNDRNFLSLAQLAPGVTFGCSGNCAGGDAGGINVGAASANNVNVFVDGVSFKNDILKGGVAGQDASKGNPFPQVAVQEFRIITQQYKAEYQKASSAVVTAQTKSGTNDWSGSLFAFRQNKDLIEQDFITLRTCDEGVRNNPSFVCRDQPKQDRWQLGGSVGGPIIRDKLFFFGAYEGNHQDRAETVTVGGNITAWPTALQAELRSHEGTFPSEFRSNLYFGKLTYVPGERHRVEFSGSVRDEFDIRNFSGTQSLENAEHFNNDVSTFQLKHQFATGSLLNEAQVSYQKYRWFPVQLNPDIPGRDYAGTMKVGGRCCPQDQTQSRVSLRNDVSYTLPGWAGDHVFKVGANLDFIDYDIIKQLNVNPQFSFQPANPTVPTQVAIGFGEPNIGAENKQFGIYAQDDWSPTQRLTFNLGVRWDYETNGLNNDYVTPANVVAEVRGNSNMILINDDYFTDGDDRPGYKGMIQPRLGFSLDLTGRNTTVLFGGYGIYYDRNSFATLIGERERLVWTTYTIRFSPDGSVPGTVAWDPAYLGPNGRDLLQTRIQSGTFGRPEAFLMDNNTKPPRADQFSLGVRQAWRSFLFSVNYSGVRGYNEFTWHFANRNALGTVPALRQPATPSFQNILVSTDEGKSWYDAFMFKVERQYTRESRWGGQINYTLSWADDYFGAGRDFAGLDFRTPDDFVRRDSERDERHRVSANAIVGLPFDVRLSGILNLASGRKFRVFYGGDSCRNGNQDCIGNEYPVNGVIDGTVGGTDPFTGEPIRESFLGIGGWAFRNVDLRLEKEFEFRGNRIGLIGEVFNVFNYDNFANYEGFIADLTPTGTLANIRHPALGCVENTATVAQECNFGRPTAVVSDTRLTGAPRRFQFGLQYSM